MPTIEIRKSDTLIDLERKLVEIQNVDPSQEISFRLSRNPSARFFTSSRLAGLIATASERGRVCIEDWHNHWEESDRSDIFRKSLSGLAAAKYGDVFSNLSGESPPFDVTEIQEEVAFNNGIMEPHNSVDKVVGSTLTYCAFDPDYTEPLALSGLLYQKQKFSRDFAALKRRHFERDQGDRTMDLFAENPEEDLAQYVFELYQNGYEHGRYGIDKSTILPGLRYISVRKHIATSEEILREYSSGFSELDQYLKRHSEESKGFKYYEVSVSDRGLGIIRRFLMDRPDHTVDIENRNECGILLRKLLTESLTSKKSADGAGGGLLRALRAVKTLNGFLTLRTDKFWYCAAFPRSDDTLPTSELREVRCDVTLERIAGTHFNAIIPLRR